jgi:hypothetical protein
MPGVFSHICCNFDRFFLTFWAHFTDKYSELISDYISEAVNTSGRSILSIFSLLLTFGQVDHGSSMIITYLNLFQVCFLTFSVILIAFFDFLNF